MAKTETRIEGDDLILRARTDSNALGELYDLYYPRIFRYCVYRVFTRETADDLTSEIFLTVARNIGTLGTFKGCTKEEFCNWLYAIANNLINAYMRKEIRRKDLFASAIKAGTFGHTDGIEEKHGVDWPVLYQAILQLKPKQQAIIILRFFENLTHEQIAKILSTKAVTVRGTCARALKKLRKSLQAHFEMDS
ncbi:MAG: RNA polymerase sigma factor [Planctomycetota bacterium]